MTDALKERLDIALPIDYGWAFGQRIVVGRQIEFRCVHSDAARLQRIEAVDYELQATFEIAEMLKAARRPAEVESAQAPRDEIHIAELECHTALKSLRIDDRWLEKDGCVI